MTKQLDILGTNWLLHEGTEPLPADTMLGFMDAMHHRILLQDDVFQSWKLYLLLHEVIHALVFLGHLQFLKSEDGFHDDESRVDAIASLMAHFIHNNKSIIDDYTKEV